jgi:tetratricopeptide (TPR) repeat protein
MTTPPTPPGGPDPTRPTPPGGRLGGAHVDSGVKDHARVEQAGRDQIRVGRLEVRLGEQARLPAGGLAGLLRGRGRRVWNIPLPVRSFTGRDQQLADLRAQLTSQQAAALVPTTALHGMGGVGKTQLALTYAHRYLANYQLGWWIPAETEVTISTALAGLAAELGLPSDLSANELAAHLAALLAGEDGWLLVFDNAASPAMLSSYLPGGGGGHVLVTSRSPSWQGVADPVAVDVLALGEAAGLLQRRSGDGDEQAAVALAGALGRLPLALEQAAAYTSQYGLTLASYLELFDQRRAELLARGTPLAYQGTVDATFTLALDQLRGSNPAAVQLVELCALLAPVEIPLPLLLSKPTLLPEPLADAAADPLQRREVVGVLYQAGLLTRDVAHTARVHRLVQDVTLAHLPEADRHQRTAKAVDLLAELFPRDGQEPKKWPECAELLAHAQILLGHARTAQLTSPEVADLLTSTSIYLWARGLDIRLAFALDEQALAMCQRLYEGDHPHVARSLHNLAVDLRVLGEHVRARELAEQALAMRQRLYEGDHPDLAHSLYNLAIDLRALGEDARALELDEQALAMRQRLYEGDHLHVARSLYNLAIDLRVLGEDARARELDEQALAMLQRL